MAEFTEDNLLTNFHARQLSLYLKAVEEYGDTTIYISSVAYDISGKSLREYYSLRTEVNCDRSDFWKLFNKLRKY